MRLCAVGAIKVKTGMPKSRFRAEFAVPCLVPADRMRARLNKLGLKNSGVRMSIDRVESLVYGVEDMEACVRFLEDWGLEQVEAG